MGKSFLTFCLWAIWLPVFSQHVAGVTGPSLINTIDWVSNNVVDISIDDSRQYRQRLSYDADNNCSCRFLVNSLSKSGDERSTEYSFDFKDIDPDEIKIEEDEGLVEISLKTYEKKKLIKVMLEKKEENTYVILIYERDKENATRLVRALSHISNLCKQ